MKILLEILLHAMDYRASKEYIKPGGRKTMSKTLEEREQRERERQQIIDEAYTAADRIILNGSNGSEEETNYLTAEVAERMIKRALLLFSSGMLRKDLR